MEKGNDTNAFNRIFIALILAILSLNFSSRRRITSIRVLAKIDMNSSELGPKVEIGLGSKIGPEVETGVGSGIETVRSSLGNCGNAMFYYFQKFLNFVKSVMTN